MTKQTPQPFHLIIPAAGLATRMGKNQPKPYIKIGQKAILRHTIDKFMDIKGLQSVLVIINEEHQNLYNDATQGLDHITSTIGSKTRKQSIYNGLKSLYNVKNDDLILIHDAARPLVQEQDIENLLQTMQTAEAATLATPVTDTLYNEEQGKDIDRDKLWAIQTPQAFRFGALKEAHEKFKEDDRFTDDAGLIRATGKEVTIVPASRNNIKITTAEDLDIVAAALQNTRETRTASGFDVHAFEKEKTERPLMLGGIQISHDFALTGHSDADVILHAITDAILGGINEGDIGTHFPPLDPQWKDAPSALFLKHAADMLSKIGGIIQFIDITVMAEAPKIGPHREAIQTKIAEILGLSTSRISIKATTTEQLGFTGRKEGIACQAIATLSLPMTN